MFHGNYCGPYWSDGRFQTSVVGTEEPVDEFDATCMIHDAVYAVGGDLAEADGEFYRRNIGRGLTRSVAAVIVGAQGVVRRGGFAAPNIVTIPNSINMTKSSKARKNTPTQPLARQKNKPARPTMRTDVPVTSGYTIRPRPSSLVRTANGATVMGSDFAGSVQVFNTSVYEPAASVMLNPSYFQSAVLGNMSRVYEKYRFKRAILEYIPSVPTSTQGQLVIISDRTIKNPFMDGSGSSFLAKSLSQVNAVACPLWSRTEFVCETRAEWSNVDPLEDGDLDDTINLEVQIYGFSTATMTSGILMLHYEIEFKDPLYTFHNTVIPVPVGVGSTVVMSDANAVNAITTAIRLGGASIALGALGDGAVYRMVFQQKPSVYPTGPANWGAVASVGTTGGGTTTTVLFNRANINMAPGTTVYGILVGSFLHLYASYDAAVGGGNAGQLYYQTATTAVGTWQFLIMGVRLGNQFLVTNQ